ncbi:MAG: prepilin-type N-terminal cleavage/methylation domain-containing protein [Candidatus Cloacimonetes bacterium]|jgi:type II secretory pathway pseudopilin PulG|nr:hypothetical protein [Candidatus Cloacimonadota bacterium]MCK9332986.1 hypothetical protein [Candidatus Cloacimonadota bacterium]MDD3282324.1 prepilin-type N-terminal cleavage/methylation domain-containing protein [Candidatus Cloacimonadota bacterium]MDD4686474.1 prepilin-type N-terminal cleavage/methylation domain-containing protein [Candidatus Cloacimonadota bacterium]MDY0299560.1 prepilin-type N-terminal cleavage/methylation domain-containing protein [Candidatus Cloacimonadaceae bacterium
MKNLGIVNNNKGTTLIEILVVVIISTVLIAISAVGIIAFYNSYNRMKAYVDLQQGVMKSINMMRNGVLMPASDGNLMGIDDYSSSINEFWGASSALRLDIPNYNPFYGWGTRLRIYPVVYTQQQNNDFLEYYIDQGVIRATYSYNGVNLSSPLYIFPEREERDKIEVTSLKFIDANKSPYYRRAEDESFPLIGIEISARALVKDNPNANKREYKEVTYKTYVAQKFRGSE